MNIKHSPKLIALALGVALSGCAGLPTDVLSSLTANLNPQQKSAVDGMVNDTIAALQTSSDMNVASSLSADPTVQSLRVLAESATGSPDTERAHREHKFHDRLQKKRSDVHSVTRETIQDPDGYASGSVMVKVTMTMSTRAGTQTHVEERVTLKDAIIAEVHDLTRSNKKNQKLASHRERKRNADGTWTVSFTETITRPDGKTKTIAWTRTEAADGSQTGTGTITRFDGSTVTITITKTADGTVETKTVDSTAKVDADITKNDGDTAANVTVTDEAKGTVVGSTTVADTESVEPSDK